MSRLQDAEIPSGESLYRSVSDEEVNGDDILPTAVDLPRCSFNRSAYSRPESVFTSRRPGDTGIVEIQPQRLPPPVPRASGDPYEFLAVDHPNPPEDPENDAHCEVRIKPSGHDFSKNHKVGKEILAKAKDALARRLRIYMRPRGKTG
ncbi:MAG: hypothetical protein JW940_22440 [Polyangiaceae bacterium]|nr:hypothetical protein [Polyangiaceae bacterium]